MRTVQYFSRFYSWYLYRTNNPASTIAPWTATKVQLGLARKIMRIGKFVEHIRAAAELYDASQKVAANGGDKISQYLQITRQLGYAGYLTLDTMTVLDAAGIVKSARAKELQKRAFKAWFVGLLASAIAGVYSNYKLSVRARQVDEKDPDAKVESKKIEKYATAHCDEDCDEFADTIYRQRKVTNIQLLSDLCDLTVPSTAIGYANFDDGIVGLAGTVSSLLGVWGVWQKTA
jgi:peroxin-11B